MYKPVRLSDSLIWGLPMRYQPLKLLGIIHKSLFSYYSQIFWTHWKLNLSCDLTWQAAKHYSHSLPPVPWTEKRMRKKNKVELMGWGKNYILRQKKEEKERIIVVIKICTKQVMHKQLFATHPLMPSLPPSSGSLPNKLPTDFKLFPHDVELHRISLLPV